MKPTRFGAYLLLERLAVGGMAEVFLAKTFSARGFEQYVALKRILPEIARDQQFVTMFIDEAKIAGQLSHPNIARIDDLGKVDDSHFIAMEYVRGHDLRELMERVQATHAKAPPEVACAIILRVCEALEYAHNKRGANGKPLNIVHRDISPQNILVSYDGDVKVIDFGIAKAVGKAGKTQSGILKGKFGYMSPEQVRGLPVDRRSDVFSLGICFYEVLTGHRLFSGESDFSVLEKVRNVEMLPLSQRDPALSERMESVVLRALAKDVEDRYRSASELYKDLEQCVRAEALTCTKEDLAQYMQNLFAEEYAQDLEKHKTFEHRSGEPQDFDGPRGFEERNDTPHKSTSVKTQWPQESDHSAASEVNTRDNDAAFGQNNPYPRANPGGGMRSDEGQGGLPSRPHAALALRDRERMQRADLPHEHRETRGAGRGDALDAGDFSSIGGSAEDAPTELFDAEQRSPGSVGALPERDGGVYRPYGPGSSGFFHAAGVHHEGPRSIYGGWSVPGGLHAPVDGSVGVHAGSPSGVGQQPADSQPIDSGAHGPYAASSRRPSRASSAMHVGRTRASGLPGEEVSSPPFGYRGPASAGGTPPTNRSFWDASETVRTSRPAEAHGRMRRFGIWGGGLALVCALVVGLWAWWSPRAATVQLMTDPSDAIVYFDDEPLLAATSPFVFSNVKPETPHLIVVKKEGYRTWSKQLVLQPGQRLVLPLVRLVPQPLTSDGAAEAEETSLAEIMPPKQEASGASAALVVASQPSGAKVYVDNRLLKGRTPLRDVEVDPGRHLVRIEHDGFMPWESEVKVAEGQVVHLPDVTLRPKAVRVAFVSEPAGASVVLIREGESLEVGRTPVMTEVDPSAGRWSVRFNAEGHEPVIETLDVKPGTETAEVSAKLPKLAASSLAPLPAKSRSVEAPSAPSPRASRPPRTRPSRPAASEAAPAGDQEGQDEQGEEMATASAGTGTLRINSRPWASISINGASMGNTPQMNLELPVGTHTVVLENPEFGAKKTVKIRIRAGQTVTKVIDLTQGS